MTRNIKVDTRKSAALFTKAQTVMVGGVNSPVRSFQGVGGVPLMMQKGKGSRFFDSDGNGYTDYCLSWGSLILGHAHKDVISSIHQQIREGISFGTTTKPEIDLAKHIVRCVPSIDQIRFVNSGTEATMSAIRLARGVTKRDLVVKFDGCYHGHFDDLLVKAGSGVANLKKSSSLGITRNHTANTLSLPFNDTETLGKILQRYKDKIACVILEPVAGNMGVIPPKMDFLKTLRRLTKRYKSILIFDEIMTGFRSSLGGVQADLDVIPDITCLGKIIGGGFPIGAYGGRADIMRHLAPLGGVYQAGTFSGSPVVMSAGLSTLKNLNQAFYRDLKVRSQRFVTDINSWLKKNEIPAYLSHYHAMMSIRFRKEEVFDYADALNASSSKLYAQLFQDLLQQGIYLPPADLESFFVSGSHEERQLHKLARAIKSFFRDKHLMAAKF